jgi:DNA repair exonuclease SbcCD ATPase subunit
MSYGNNTTIVDFNNTGTTLIIGEDLDNTTNGQGGNGVGKTSIMNALTFAVYDRPISKIKADELVNNINKKHMEVSVTFKKGDWFYKIVRARKMKAGAAGNYVKLYERYGDADFDNSDEKTLDSIINTDKRIEDIMGMTYDMFVRIVVISANHTPFLDLPVSHPTQANQTDFVERLFDLVILSEKAAVLKDSIKATEETLKISKLKMEHLGKESQRLAEQIKSAKTRVINWERNNEDTITSLEMKLAAIAGVDFDNERRLHDELELLDAEVTSIINKQHDLEKSIKQYSKIKQDMERDLLHLNDDRCPYCLQQYQHAESKISECESSLLIAQTKLNSYTAELVNIDAIAVTKIEDKLRIKKQITVTNLEELVDIRNQSNVIREKIEDLKNATNPFIEPLEELEGIVIEEVNYDEINRLVKYIDHQQFLVKLLTKKDSFVRKAFLNKNLPFLNNRLQLYLSQLGLTHKVEFNHEMTAEITQFGRSLGFGNLSNGQRARVNIALSMAFRDVLQKLHTPINICLLDEVLDVGLDPVGVQSAARMLKRKARDEQLCMFIVSHRDEVESSFDRTMVVQMIKGFSYIKDAIME